MTNNNETIEIDLRELFGVLLQKLWLLVIVTMVFGAAAFGYTYTMVDPLYKASILLYVNNSDISVGSTSVSISNADLVASQKLVDTYVVILRSRTALNDVIKEANLNYSYEKLRSMISASSVESTEVFEVVVTSTSPTEAELIANTIARIMPEKITDIVVGSDVRIVDYAVVPSHRSSPSYTRNTAIGALLGLVLSAGFVIVTHLFDENIRSEDYLTQTYPDIPLLAVIPDMNPSKQSSGSGYGYGYGSSSSRRKSSSSHSSSSSKATSGTTSKSSSRSGGSASSAHSASRPGGTASTVPHVSDGKSSVPTKKEA